MRVKDEGTRGEDEMAWRGILPAVRTPEIELERGSAEKKDLHRSSKETQ